VLLQHYNFMTTGRATRHVEVTEVGVTIRDVAAAAAVSKSTVSRAFARPGSVNDDTRRRIFAVANDLGYQPIAPARPSRSTSSGQIGLFIPDIANPFYPRLIKAVQIAGRRLGLSLVIIGGDDDPQTDYREIHRVAPDVDGMLILGPRLAAEQDGLFADRVDPEAPAGGRSAVPQPHQGVGSPSFRRPVT
jgi:DNA-binding LacI/PurR family transcriptional regulator